MEPVSTDPPYGLPEAQTDIAFAMTGDLYRNVRALKQVTSLAARGHTVTVLALAGTAPPLPLPAGVRVRTMPFPAGSGPNWFLDVHRGMHDMLTMLAPRHVHASDLYVLPASSRRARRSGIPLTYDARELYPHVASTVRKPWATWFWRLVEGRFIGQAETVFTVSGRIADHMARVYRIERPRVIYNAPDFAREQAGPEQAGPEQAGPEQAVGPADDTGQKTAPGDIRSVVGLGKSVPLVVHVGQIREGRGVDRLVRALTSMPSVHVVLLGYGPQLDAMMRLATSEGTAGRLHLLHPVSPWDVPRFIATATVGVTLLDDSCLNHRYALPNKLFDYFAAGLPVVASDLPEIRDVLNRFGAGLTVPRGENMLGRTIMNAIQASERLGSGSRAASSEMNWRAVEPAFCSAFQP